MQTLTKLGWAFVTFLFLVMVLLIHIVTKPDVTVTSPKTLPRNVTKSLAILPPVDLTCVIQIPEPGTKSFKDLCYSRNWNERRMTQIYNSVP